MLCHASPCLAEFDLGMLPGQQNASNLMLCFLDKCAEAVESPTAEAHLWT